MQSRLLLAILISSLASGILSPSALSWSPLATDAKGDVSSTEQAEELSEFHDLRRKVTDEETRLRDEEKKKRKWLGKFRRTAKPVLVKSTKRDLENPSVTPSGAKASDAVGPEPGTAPAKELADEASEEATDEDTDEKKKEPVIPGQKPTEEVSDAGYFIKRSHSFAMKKDYQSALNYVDKALELQPQNYDAWYQKALVYQLAGYDAAAARRYLELISRHPEMIEARIGMGMLYRKHGNLDLAEKEYQDAIEFKFYSFPAHFNLANLYMDQKKYEQALKEYKVCMKLKPNNALVHNNMGVIFQHRNYLEEAADEFRKAANLDPANKMFANNLSSVRTQLGQKGGKPGVTM